MSQQKSGHPFHSIDHITEFDALNPFARENLMPYYDWLRADSTRNIYRVSHKTDSRMQVATLKELIEQANSLMIDESNPLRMVTDRDNGILRFEKLYVIIN